MLENLNYQLFYLINATPASRWMIDFATFLRGSDQHRACTCRLSVWARSQVKLPAPAGD
jgi:hypothetical protein